MPWAHMVGYEGPDDDTALELDMSLRASSNSHGLPDLQQSIESYSWVIPSHEALSSCVRLAKTGKIIEIGSGSGYWTSLLRGYGADVIAVDPHPASRHFIWDTIRRKGEEYLTDQGGCPDRALFMCWPRGSFGDKVLQAYNGDTLLWIGEAQDGWQTTWSLKETRFPDWHLIESIILPSWVGMKPILCMYQKCGPRA